MHVGLVVCPPACLPANGRPTDTTCVPSVFALDRDDFLAHSYPGQVMEILLTQSIKPAARRFSLDEYYRMAEAGILRPNERVELLDGQILCMAPIGDNHQDVVDALSEILGDQRKNRYRVRAGGPIRIEHFDEPQPDIVLYKRGVKKHPTPGEIYLVVEVSDTTLAYDSGAKLRAYEHGGIQEYWIVDLTSKSVHIHRLKEGRYGVTIRRHGTIHPENFADVTVDLGQLF
jgi:Uma2 family endonuclease